MTNRNHLGKTVLAAVCALGLAPPAIAQTALDEIIAGAAQEGEVVFNTLTTRFPPETGDNLAAAIRDRFGVDLDIRMTSGASSPVTAGTIISEHEAGVAPAFDTLALTLLTGSRVNAVGAIADVDWAAIGVPPEQISPAGNSVWLRTTMRTVIYNTDLVTGDDIPTRYEDLLDPKWRGRIAGPGNGGALATALAPVLGEDEGAEWLSTAFNDQEYAVIPKLTDIPNRVANGEFLLGFGLSANYAGLADKGAPVANAPIETVSGLPYYQFVLEGAEHPNASALMIYFFCCTEEGRQVLNSELNWGLTDTVGTEPYEIASDGRAVIPSADWQLNRLTPVAERYDAVVGR